MFSSRKKKHFETASTPVASGLVSSQVTQQLQFPTNSQSQSQSQSHLQSPQEKQQVQPVCPWSAHTPPFGQSPSPFLRNSLALSTSATAAGELFLFGGYVQRSWSLSNDLYVISTRDFSTTLLQTSGHIPSPRYAHRAVLTDTTLLIWGGRTDLIGQNAQNQSNDDSFYLLNLVSREWTRIVVNGPGPGRRYYHTMSLVGSKLFVFGGQITKRLLNDIWALDLNCLKSNPVWESYEPAPGNKKPLPRAGHVSVTTGDHIIIFGGCDGPHYFNDTWSFNISTRKWTELQCTGSIPSPRAGHAAVLVGDVMYVFGGQTIGRVYPGNLTAFNMSTQRWFAFQDIGPSPCGRSDHAMACDGTRVFVLGGALCPGAHWKVEKTELIWVLDTKLLIYPEPDSNIVKHSGKTIRLAQKLSAGHLTQGQPQHGIFSSSDAGETHGAFPFHTATSGEMGHTTSPQITHERNPRLNGLPSQPTGVDYKPRCVLRGDDDSESSTGHHPKLVAPDASSEKEVARLEHERIADLERQLSETLAERDRHIAQLTDQLAQKSALLERAEANAAEAKKNAGLELRELQAKLDESLLPRDHAREQAQTALQRASCAAEANEQSQRKLEASKSESAAFRLRLADTENGCAESKAKADTYRNQTATALVSTDEDRVVHRLLEGMQCKLWKPE